MPQLRWPAANGTACVHLSSGLRVGGVLCAVAQARLSSLPLCVATHLRLFICCSLLRGIVWVQAASRVCACVRVCLRAQQQRGLVPRPVRTRDSVKTCYCRFGRIAGCCEGLVRVPCVVTVAAVWWPSPCRRVVYFDTPCLFVLHCTQRVCVVRVV
jgi:hypothetical protein